MAISSAILFWEVPDFSQRFTENTAKRLQTGKFGTYKKVASKTIIGVI